MEAGKITPDFDDRKRAKINSTIATRLNRMEKNNGLTMDVMKVDGPAGFWIFCKSYSELKSSKVIVISFEHL